jgi:hypothetical protein
MLNTERTISWTAETGVGSGHGAGKAAPGRVGVVERLDGGLESFSGHFLLREVGVHSDTVGTDGMAHGQRSGQVGHDEHAEAWLSINALDRGQDELQQRVGLVATLGK